MGRIPPSTGGRAEAVKRSVLRVEPVGCSEDEDDPDRSSVTVSIDESKNSALREISATPLFPVRNTKPADEFVLMRIDSPISRRWPTKIIVELKTRLVCSKRPLETES